MESDSTSVTPSTDLSANCVGRVQGLLDSTPLLWHVAVQDTAYLQLDDVVVTVRDVPGRGSVTTSGIVTDVSARHEGASFGSDVFLISDGILPPRFRRSPRLRPPGSTRSSTFRHGLGRQCAGPPALNAPGHCTSTRWNTEFLRAPAAMAKLFISIRSSLTGLAAHTYQSPEFRGSPPKPHLRYSCCMLFFAGTLCVIRTMPKRLSSRSRARTCCSWISPTAVCRVRMEMQYARITPVLAFRLSRSPQPRSMLRRLQETGPDVPT